ncbi:enoyl-CoA hydratase/isomerase family protein [Brevibacterium sp. SMBL_HHYL_HB1]|jgi:enoyl-CoA hydratase/carnithine racemase|uniref:enoyl-CoA hydratase/isomerase family protein n=1 Tax=Brevibacterium sp. SMBL_HHYL_HB1 TaxID=2777556 RepID=UPI001BAD980A|nr:enoyl-CoA hydratase/isomerase family protein [Brevibacterium sp. SMBL_HHYL_HB1]QUL78701.1 enoyl-CoA hydratase/isomerase family protein [Brevibacterium sp. SMBL_HHYL_HB1]
MSATNTQNLIQHTVTDDVAVISLNRPDKLNALNASMLHELADLVQDYGTGDLVKGLVVTGAGRAFSAGHDLAGGNQASSAQEIADSVNAFHNVSRACLRTAVPTIAALNGLAVGGAFEMTLAFDRRIATASAEVFLPENSLGLTVSNASSFLLGKLLSRGDALDFVLGARRVGAEDAKRLGLIDELIELDLVSTAIARVHEYTPPNCSTQQHLRLLRPSIREVEEAMENETAEAIAAWETGLTARGNESFWKKKRTS